MSSTPAGTPAANSSIRLRNEVDGTVLVVRKVAWLTQDLVLADVAVAKVLFFFITLSNELDRAVLVIRKVAGHTQHLVLADVAVAQSHIGSLRLYDVPVKDHVGLVHPKHA